MILTSEFGDSIYLFCGLAYGHGYPCTIRLSQNTRGLESDDVKDIHKSQC